MYRLFFTIPKLWVGRMTKRYTHMTYFKHVMFGILWQHIESMFEVVNFLCWAAEPAHDERKLIGLKVTG